MTSVTSRAQQLVRENCVWRDGSIIRALGVCWRHICSTEDAACPKWLKNVSSGTLNPAIPVPTHAYSDVFHTVDWPQQTTCRRPVARNLLQGGLPNSSAYCRLQNVDLENFMVPFLGVNPNNPPPLTILCLRAWPVDILVHVNASYNCSRRLMTGTGWYSSFDIPVLLMFLKRTCVVSIYKVLDHVVFMWC